VEDMKRYMLEKKVWAVVGANDKKDRFGYKLYKVLKNNNYEVYPVNPNYDMIEGDVCYPDLKSLPVRPEVIDMVVNPKIGTAVVEEAGQLGIENIWFQPGSSNESIIGLARERIKNVIDHECVLAELSARR